MAKSTLGLRLRQYAQDIERGGLPNDPFGDTGPLKEIAAALREQARIAESGIKMIAMTPERVGAIAMLNDEDAAEQATKLNMEEWLELCSDSREIVKELLAEVRRG